MNDDGWVPGTKIIDLSSSADGGQSTESDSPSTSPDSRESSPEIAIANKRRKHRSHIECFATRNGEHKDHLDASELVRRGVWLGMFGVAGDYPVKGMPFSYTGLMDKHFNDKDDPVGQGWRINALHRFKKPVKMLCAGCKSSGGSQDEGLQRNFIMYDEDVQYSFWVFICYLDGQEVFASLQHDNSVRLDEKQNAWSFLMTNGKYTKDVFLVTDKDLVVSDSPQPSLDTSNIGEIGNVLADSIEEADPQSIEVSRGSRADRPMDLAITRHDSGNVQPSWSLGSRIQQTEYGERQRRRPKSSFTGPINATKTSEEAPHSGIKRRHDDENLTTARERRLRVEKTVGSQELRQTPANNPSVHLSTPRLTSSAEPGDANTSKVSDKFKSNMNPRINRKGDTAASKPQNEILVKALIRGDGGGVLIPLATNMLVEEVFATIKQKLVRKLAGGDVVGLRFETAEDSTESEQWDLEVGDDFMWKFLSEKLSRKSSNTQISGIVHVESA